MQNYAAWVAGAQAFNDGRYWDAHEFWERGWKDLPELDRRAIQYLIQGASVFHLLSLGRIDAAMRLSRRALEHLSWLEGQGVPAEWGRARSGRPWIAGLGELLAQISAQRAPTGAQVKSWLVAGLGLRAQIQR